MNQRNEEPNELEVIFDDLDNDLSLEKLAIDLHATAINGTIDFSTGGSGFIKRIKIANGFNLRIWDYSSPYSIIYRRPKSSKGRTFFHICYPINTADFLVSNSFFPQLVHLPWGRNIVFFSSDAVVNMKTLGDKRFKAIDVSFTAQWLKETFSEDPTVLAAIEQLININEPLILLDSTSPGDQLAISQIHLSIEQETQSGLQLKAKALLLVDEFFNRLLRLGQEQFQRKKIVYDEQIRSVKKILEEYLEESFPGMEVIAAKVSLSESTLKRYFKAVFNKSIHEYYLLLKMDHARELIVNRHLTINEVAAILKYEKVSSFIETFKRHFGYSPGKLKNSPKGRSNNNN
jgi:AraC-like DNA-binding protein